MGHTNVHIWLWILLHQYPQSCADEGEHRSLAPCLQSAPLHIPASTILVLGVLGVASFAHSLYCLFMDLLSLDLSNPFLNTLILSACGRCSRSSLWQQIPEIHYCLTRNVSLLLILNDFLLVSVNVSHS